MIAVSSESMKLVLLVLTVEIVASASLLSQEAGPLNQLADEAENALAEGRPERAVKILEDAIARAEGRRPEEAAGLYLILARVQLERNDPEETIASLDEAQKLGGASREEPLLRAQALLTMGESAASLELLAPLELSGPPFTDGHAVLCEALLSEGKRTRAEALLVRLRQNDATPWTLHRLGVLFHERGEHHKAVEVLREAIDKDANDYYSRIYVARSLLELERPDDAVRTLEAVRRVADTPEVTYLLGRAAAATADPKSAVAHFRATLERQPTYTEALYGLSCALRDLDETEESRRTFLRFQKLHREDSRRLVDASRFEQELVLSPEDTGVALRAARFHLREKNYNRAERTAWRVLRRNPLDVTARMILARALGAQGRYQEAALHYQKTLRIQPDHTEAQRELEGLVERHRRRRR